MAKEPAGATPGTPDLTALVARLRKYELRLRKAVTNQGQGAFRSVFRGTGLEFADVRPYQYGDDVRLIDWNVSAKGHGTFTRQYREERERQVLLLLDVSASQKLGPVGQQKLDVARELSGILALVAARQDAQLGLVCFSSKLEAYVVPGKGMAHAYQLIKTLYALQPAAATTDLAQAIRRTLGMLRRRSLVILLSDLIDDNFDRELTMLARTHELVVLHLIERRERRLPPLGIVPLRDKETGRVVWTNTSAPDFRTQQARYRDNQTRIAQLCRRYRARLIPVYPDRDYVPALLDLFLGRAPAESGGTPAVLPAATGAGRLATWLLAASLGGFSTLPVHAQLTPPPPRFTTRPVGAFARPVVRLGEVVAFDLIWRHPATQAVILPDSTADFRPFELVRSTWRPTRTRAGQSTDRTTYYVRTFDAAPQQALTLGGRLLTSRGDTVVVPGQGARVQVQFATPAPADVAQPPALRPLLAPEEVRPRFNWPWWLTGAAAVGLLLATAALIFGKRLRARYRHYRLRKNHQYFLAQLARYTERFALSRSVHNLERGLTLWKNYLTGLEGRPIASLTTKEIVAAYGGDERVARALRLGDRAIYGNQLSDADDGGPDPELAALTALRAFAEERYARLTAAAPTAVPVTLTRSPPNAAVLS